MKAYNYLYFGLYRLFSKSENCNDVAEHIAFFVLSGCLAVDIFALSLPIRHSFYAQASVKAIIITMCFSIGLINYFYFVRGRRYLKLIEKYKNTAPKKLQTMDKVAIAFCALSFVSPVLFGIIKYYLL
jgi:ABC-type Fe3+ transport system permease subunit